MFSFDKLTQIRSCIRTYISTVDPGYMFPRSREAALKIERITLTYLSHNSTCSYSPPIVHMAGPFVRSIGKESTAYHTFSQFLDMLNYHFGDQSIGKALALFLMLFRKLHPDLYAYFEDNQLNPNEWALQWLRTLLANILPLHNIVRLWDTYLASDEGLHLHIYVCLGEYSYSLCPVCRPGCFGTPSAIVVPFLFVSMSVTLSHPFLATSSNLYRYVCLLKSPKPSSCSIKKIWWTLSTRSSEASCCVSLEETWTKPYCMPTMYGKSAAIYSYCDESRVQVVLERKGKYPTVTFSLLSSPSLSPFIPFLFRLFPFFFFIFFFAVWLFIHNPHM